MNQSVRKLIFFGITIGIPEVLFWIYAMAVHHIFPWNAFDVFHHEPEIWSIIVCVHIMVAVVVAPLVVGFYIPSWIHGLYRWCVYGETPDRVQEFTAHREQRRQQKIANTKRLTAYQSPTVRVSAAYDSLTPEELHQADTEINSYLEKGK